MNEDDLLESFAADLRREFPPAAISPHLPAAIQHSLAGSGSDSPETALRSSWFASWWLSVLAPAGAALAVLFAALMLLAPQPFALSRHRVASTETAAATTPATRTAKAVTDDPALTFSADDTVEYRTRRDYVDTLRWRDRRTGAQLEVSYPRAEIVTASYSPL